MTAPKAPRGSSLWSSKPEDWDKFPEFSKEDLAKLNSLEFHGCNTGDCPHDTQAECDATLVKAYKEELETVQKERDLLLKEVEILRTIKSLAKTCLVAEDFNNKVLTPDLSKPQLKLEISKWETLKQLKG